MSHDPKPCPITEVEPCRERPAIGTRVVFTRSAHDCKAGAAALVTDTGRTSGLVRVLLHDGRSMTVSWDLLGVPVDHGAEQPDAPTAKAATDPVPADVDARLEALKAGVCTLEIRADNLADRADRLEHRAAELGKMVSAQGECILDLQERQKREEDHRGRAQEVKQEERLKDLETLVHSIDAAAVKSLAALNALAHHDHTDALASRIEHMDGLLSQLDNTLCGIKNSLANAQAGRDEAHKRADVAEAKLNALRGERDAACEHARRYSDRVAELEAKVRELETDLDDQRKRAEKAENEIFDARRERDVIAESATALRAERDLAVRERESAIEHWSEDSLKLKVVQKQLEEARADVANARDERDAAHQRREEEVAKQRAELDKAIKRAVSAEDTIRRAGGNSAALGEGFHEIYQYIVAAYEQEFEEVDDLTPVRDLVRHAFVTLAERSKEVRRLKTQVGELEQRLDTARSAVDAGRRLNEEAVGREDSVRGNRDSLVAQINDLREKSGSLEARLKTATANTNQILENLGRVTRQRDELGAEVERLRALIPESDPRRDPNWKPEEAPPVGEIPHGIVEAIQAQMDDGRFGPKAKRSLTAEEVARIEASAKAAGVHSAIAEACERVAANAPLRQGDRVRIINQGAVSGLRGKVGTVVNVRGGNVSVVLHDVAGPLSNITCPPDYLERVVEAPAQEEREFRRGDRVCVVDKGAGGRDLTGRVGTVRCVSENGVSVSFEHRRNELFLFLPANLEIARQRVVVLSGSPQHVGLKGRIEELLPDGLNADVVLDDFPGCRHTFARVYLAFVQEDWQ